MIVAILFLQESNPIVLQRRAAKNGEKSVDAEKKEEGNDDRTKLQLELNFLAQRVYYEQGLSCEELNVWKGGRSVGVGGSCVG